MATPRQQPARTSARIELHEERTGREVSMESIAFAHARDKRRRKNALAKAARRKNRS